MTRREFAKGMIALEHQSLPHTCDFDTHPPEALITALAGYSGYRRSELERLAVHPSGSTLPPEYRDAYCPVCMREDRAKGIVYFRRAWLDAWTLICERHDCPLGEFQPLEYQAVEPAITRSPFSQRRKPYRRNPTVTEVTLPFIRGAKAELDPHILADMLKSLAGRDLLLVMGSDAANGLVYDLCGLVRLWNAVWHGPDRSPRGPPELEQPFGSIKVRLWSAYFASFLWQTFLASEHRATSADLVVTWRAACDLMRPLMSRWRPEERLRAGHR